MLRNVFDISHFVDVRTEQAVKADLVARVVRKRKEAKLTQPKLAKLAGISCGSLRRFEQTGEISLSSLIKIGSVLQSIYDFDALFAQSYIGDLQKEWEDEHKKRENKHKKIIK